jgi:hypothetical protein
MNISEMQLKLKQAQDLLSDVYHFACDNGIDFIERNMSCADGCIGESIDYLHNKEAQLIDDASWRA